MSSAQKIRSQGLVLERFENVLHAFIVARVGFFRARAARGDEAAEVQSVRPVRTDAEVCDQDDEEHDDADGHVSVCGHRAGELAEDGARRRGLLDCMCECGVHFIRRDARPRRALIGRLHIGAKATDGRSAPLTVDSQELVVGGAEHVKGQGLLNGGALIGGVAA